MSTIAWVVTSLFAFPLQQSASVVGEGTTVHSMPAGDVMAAEGLGMTGPTMFILWASWCRPCDVQVKRWDARVRASPGLSLAILDLQTEGDDSVADVKKLRRITSAPIILVPQAELTATWTIPGDISLPATFLVDGAGTVQDDYVVGNDDVGDRQLVAGLGAIYARLLDPGTVALDDKLPVLGGSKKKSLTLRSLLPTDGKPLFAVTWSSECGASCDALVQRWSKAEKKLRKKGLRVVIVDVGEPAKKRLKKLKLTVPVVSGDVGPAGQVIRIDADGQATQPVPDGELGLAFALRPLLGAGEPGTLGDAIRSAVGLFGVGGKLPALALDVVAGADAGKTITTKSLLKEKAAAIVLVPFGTCDAQCVPEAQALEAYQQKHDNIRIVVWVQTPEVAWWNEAGLTLPLHAVAPSASATPAWLGKADTVFADGKGLVRERAMSDATTLSWHVKDLLKR
jgi:thiol-disulfide isomerase/thioredoxin